MTSVLRRSADNGCGSERRLNRYRLLSPLSLGAAAATAAAVKKEEEEEGEEEEAPLETPNAVVAMT